MKESWSVRIFWHSNSKFFLDQCKPLSNFIYKRININSMIFFIMDYSSRWIDMWCWCSRTFHGNAFNLLKVINLDWKTLFKILLSRTLVIKKLLFELFSIAINFVIEKLLIVLIRKLADLFQNYKYCIYQRNISSLSSFLWRVDTQSIWVSQDKPVFTFHKTNLINRVIHNSFISDSLLWFDCVYFHYSTFPQAYYEFWFFLIFL